MNYFFSNQMKQMFIQDYKTHENYDFILKNHINTEIRGKIIFESYPIFYEIFHKVNQNKLNLSDDEYKLHFENKKNNTQSSKNNYYTLSPIVKKITTLSTYNNYYQGKISVCQKQLNCLFDDTSFFTESNLIINQKYLINKINEYNLKINNNNEELEKLKILRSDNKNKKNKPSINVENKPSVNVENKPSVNVENKPSINKTLEELFEDSINIEIKSSEELFEDSINIDTFFNDSIDSIKFSNNNSNINILYNEDGNFRIDNNNIRVNTNILNNINID